MAMCSEDARYQILRLISIFFLGLSLMLDFFLNPFG